MTYALLPNKKWNSYNRAYMLLKDAALNPGLIQSSIMCDFELAIIQVLSLNTLPLHVVDLAQGPISWACRCTQI